MRRVLATAPPPAEASREGAVVSSQVSAVAGPERSSRSHMRTEFDFELPRGYVDGEGNVHRHGTMRLATARDELLPLIDSRVRDNSAYLTVVVLSRVITKLGSLGEEEVTANVLENMFASDLAFLQDLYRRINTEGHTLASVSCPACHERFSVDLAGGRLGES